MSRENVELVKTLHPHPDTDLAALFRDEDVFARVREGLSPFLAEDFEVVTVLPGETRTYGGLEGLRQLWLDWLEPWATYRTTIDEVIDLGERVVVLVRDFGRREDMDTEVELIGAAIWTISEGKVIRIEHHTDRARTLEAVGLAEDAHTTS